MVYASALVLSVALLSGCSGLQVAPQASVPEEMAIRRVAPEQAQRLYAVMEPLLAAMDEPLSPRQVRVGIIDDPSINAANAGGGNFYVTTGLLQKSNKGQLRGIMAHEIAHEDLGHVAQMQLLGAGLDIGARLLEDLIPAGNIITPIAGTLIARGYSRGEEYDADRHAVDLLERAGYSREALVDSLEWIARTAGGGGGGFLSTHPATSERIAALND